MGGSAMAAPMLCWALTLGLFTPGLTTSVENARRLAASFASLGAFAAIATSFIGRHAASPPAGNSIFYAVDKNVGRAIWGSADRDLDHWKRQFLGASPEYGRLASFSSLTPLYFQSAPLVELAAPTVVVTSDEESGGKREIALRVRSPRHAGKIVLWETTGAPIDKWSFDGVTPLAMVRFSEELDAKGFRLLTGLTHEGRFTAALFAIPDEGAVVRVETSDRRTLEFRVMDSSDELAVMPPHVRPRDAIWTRGYPGDQTWVSGDIVRLPAH
jgi:hypothetical protein